MTAEAPHSAAEVRATPPVEVDEHRLRVTDAGLEVEVWRRISIVLVPAAHVEAAAEKTIAARAQLALPLTDEAEALPVDHGR